MVGPESSNFKLQVKGRGPNDYPSLVIEDFWDSIFIKPSVESIVEQILSKNLILKRTF